MAFKQVIPHYESFVWERLREIWELEKGNDYYGALMTALKLVDYLTRELKDKLKSDVELIGRVLRLATENVEQGDAFFVNMRRDVRLWEASRVLLPWFMDKLTRELDASGLYFVYRKKEAPSNIPSDWLENPPSEQ